MDKFGVFDNQGQVTRCQASIPAEGFTLSTLEPKLLYLPHKRLEVTSSAIVVLTAFLDSPNLPKEGLSGLKGKFSWRDT